MTLELRPVWWVASRASRSTTATERPEWATAYAVARPTMPPPITTTSYLGVLGSVIRAFFLRLDLFHQNGRDAQPSARVLAALGPQPQARDLGLGAGQRHLAEPLREQAADGVDVGLGQRLGERARLVGVARVRVELLEVLHRQPGREPARVAVDLL